MTSTNVAFVNSSQIGLPRRRALIVAGGMPVGPERLRTLASAATSIVAADSGLMTVQSCGLTPTVVIGDFDSVTPGQLNAVPDDARLQDQSQEDTDLEKAIRWTIEQGFHHADVVGATGDRLDHSVNAVSLVLRYRSQLLITLHDGGGWAVLADRSPVTISGQIGDRVSLIPLPACHGIRSVGMRYQLQDFDLRVGGRDGISNELVSESAELTWLEGALLIYRQIRTRVPTSSATSI